MDRSIRNFHRWTSIAFVTGVVAYMLAMSWGEPSVWFGLAAAVPLLLLLGTGLYLFALPHVARRRAGARARQ